jgi:DNA-binding NarL/FixJ family response regulator
MVNKLMIVEDNMLIRMDLEESLVESGFEICATACSGEEAITKAIDVKPELILMDIGLKGEMTGIEAASILREKINVPIIFLSGNSDLKTHPDTLAVEPIAFLVKPVDTYNLIDIIQRVESEKEEPEG